MFHTRVCGIEQQSCRCTHQVNQSCYIALSYYTILYVHPDNLTLDDVIIENQKLKDELRFMKQDSFPKDKVIQKASVFLRIEIKEQGVKFHYQQN
jgi:hypothetical protein